MKKSLLCAVLLAVMLVSCIPGALAASTQEKEADYAAAIIELETYLESKTHAPETLEVIWTAFDKLGYGQSEFFKYYTMVLIRVENNQFDTTTDLYLTMLDKGLDKALKDLPDTSIGTAQELAAYVRGRECEDQGDPEKACKYYEECITFYDASDRYFALESGRIEKTYQEAVALFNDGRYQEAQALFQKVSKHRDSGLYLDMIATELAHVWVEADCDHPRTCTHCGKTEGEPLGHDWQAATCTAPKTCARCGKTSGKKLGHDWQEATYEAPKTCARCGQTSGEPLEPPVPDGLEYEIKNGTVVITKYSGKDASVVIPERIQTYPVTSIGKNAFRNCTSLTSVSIPDSVTSIGDWAFWECTSLTSVSIPDSVTSIEEYAFFNCTGLTSVSLPASVTSIEEHTFFNCTSLPRVTIPNSVTSIKGGAFEHCTGLTSVSIPDSVTSIGDNAFRHCTSLTKVTIPNSVTSIGNGAFNGCTRLTVTVTRGSFAEIYCKTNGVRYAVK